MQDAPHLPHPVRAHTPATGRLVYAFLFGVLCYVAALLADGAEPAMRLRWLRYWSLLGAGAFAVTVPNVLLPDMHAPVLQMLNAPPAYLQRYQLRTWVPVLALFLVPALLLAYFDPGAFGRHLATKTAGVLQAFLVLVGAALYTFDHYMTLGAAAQAWHEGRAGRWYAALKEETGQGFHVPMGLVPALLATARCFGIAVAVVLGSAAVGHFFAPAAAWAPSALFLGWAALNTLRHRPVYDRHYYRTNALYGEVLGGALIAPTARDAVPYNALYWVPARWRPAVWASLRQLDRRLPLGRVVALAHLVLWILFAQGAPSNVITAYLILLLGAQNAACGLITTRAAAPPAFQLALQSVSDWILTRTWVNLRWLLPHTLSLALIALVDDGFGGASVLAWTAIDVVFAVTAAVLATYATEGRLRRKLA